MPMVPFFTRFRDLAFEEMRSVIVSRYSSLPPGAYGFLELYCNEVGCDCRRVVIQVVREDTRERVWATINYGWEKPAFYREWTHGDEEASREMAGATLDPFNQQSKYSDSLLELFKDVVSSDPAYSARLGRHYRLFKSVETSGGGQGTSPARRRGARPRKARL